MGVKRLIGAATAALEILDSPFSMEKDEETCRFCRNSMLEDNHDDECELSLVVRALRREILKANEAEEAARLDGTKTAIVDDNYHWRSMDTVPLGSKVQLLNLGGVAVYGTVTLKSVGDWLGWAPLPTRRKDDGR